LFEEMTGESAVDRVKKNNRVRSKADYKELTDAQYFKKLHDLAELEEGSASSPSASTAEPAPPERVVKERHVQSLRLQNIMMQLRKVCNHPYLFDYPCEDNGDLIIDDELVRSSGKLLLLDRLIPILIERGHKILIFSQMTSMLDILGDYFTLRKIQ